jgi:hypothetical protein
MGAGRGGSGGGYLTTTKVHIFHTSIRPKSTSTLVALGEVQVLYSDGVRKRRLVGCLVPV